MYSGGPEERGTISSVWQYFLCVRVRCVEHFLQSVRPDFPSDDFSKRALLLLLCS